MLDKRKGIQVLLASLPLSFCACFWYHLCSAKITTMGRPKRAAPAAAEKAIQGEEPATSKGNKKAKSGLAVGDELPSFELQTDTEATLSSADMVRTGLV